MLLNPELQIQLLSKIGEVNQKPLSERLPALISMREKLQADLNEDLDDLFSNVNLRDEDARPKTKPVTLKAIMGKASIMEGSPEEHEELLQKMQDELEEIYWYDREIFKLYVKHGSSYKVQRETGISRQRVMVVVNQVKQTLKQSLTK